MSMHGGVPAPRAPVIIKRNPILHILAPPLAQRTIRRSCISKSKSDLVAHNSGSWGVRLLHDVLAALFSGEDHRPLDWRFFCHSICGHLVNQFAKSFALNSVCLESGQCASQDIIWSKYHFAKVLLCQNVILPK